MMQAQNIRTALRGKPKITASTTYETFRAACPELAAFDKGAVTVGRFATQGPWEFHPDGDELLHVLDGQIEVILLTDDEPVHVFVRAGSIFIVPARVWHRQVPRPLATLLSALPTQHGPTSWAEDPRGKTGKTPASPRSKLLRPNKALERTRA